jgi:PAS domain S-box-containing protein
MRRKNGMDLEATFEQLPVGVAHSDRAGRILRFNTTFCTMLGFKPEELTGKTEPRKPHEFSTHRL